MFPNVKKNLGQQRFLIDDELKYALKEWLKGNQNNFIILAMKNAEITSLQTMHWW